MANDELVYVTGCPHVEAARDRIRQTFAEMGQAGWQGLAHHDL